MSQYSPANAEERYYFESLWAILNPAKDPSVGGQQVVDFLKKSALEPSILKSIWSMSSSTTSMTASQFYTALRFISMAQNSSEVLSIEKLEKQSHHHLPLPVFKDITVPGSLFLKRLFKLLFFNAFSRYFM